MATVDTSQVPKRMRTIRVLLGKGGLGGRGRGVKVVGRVVGDGGMEIVYTGLHRTPEEIVNAAIQEDVDVLGVSLLSGAHLTLVPRILELLRAAGAADVSVVVGGVIPDEDVEPLRAMGVAEVFGQETSPDQIVSRIRELAASRAPE